MKIKTFSVNHYNRMGWETKISRADHYFRKKTGPGVPKFSTKKLVPRTKITGTKIPVTGAFKSSFEIRCVRRRVLSLLICSARYRCIHYRDKFCAKVMHIFPVVSRQSFSNRVWARKCASAQWYLRNG